MWSKTFLLTKHNNYWKNNYNIYLQYTGSVLKKIIIGAKIIGVGAMPPLIVAPKCPMKLADRFTCASSQCAFQTRLQSVPTKQYCMGNYCVAGTVVNLAGVAENTEEMQ